MQGLESEGKELGVNPGFDSKQHSNPLGVAQKLKADVTLKLQN
jgi:hypothetical protein